MTPKQRMRYLRRWSAAWRRHWCGVRAGEPLARPDRGPSLLRDQVVAAAASVAARRGESLTADDIRRGCHVVAIGRNASSRTLTNREQDLVIAIFDRLAEGDHELQGQVLLDRHAAAAGNTSAIPTADRSRLIRGIAASGYPAAAVAAISRDAHGTSEWRSLPTDRLARLALTIRQRAAAAAQHQTVQNTAEVEHV